MTAQGSWAASLRAFFLFVLNIYPKELNVVELAFCY
jgi:hypothetical protein